MEKRIASVTDRLLQRVTLASKLWLSMLAALLLGLMLLGIAFNADQRQLTEQQLKTLGSAISQQTASSSAALILAGDELSLSINLQQLVALEQISGAEAFDRKGHRLAQAGQPSKLFIEQPILSEKTLLGTVRIHLNPQTAAYQFILPLTLISTAVVVLLLLTTTLLLARHFSRPLQALLQASEQLCDNNVITRLDQQRNDQFGQIALRLNQRFAEPAAESTSLLVASSTETNPKIVTEATEDLESLEIEHDVDSTPAVPTSDITESITVKPPTRSTEAAHLDNADQEGSSAPDTPPISTTTPKTAAEDTVEQSYLFYINHHVGGSDTLTAPERELLLIRYRKALEQVARLYKGGFNEDALGNWYVRFLPLSDDQSHGINALCAAQLFNALYRGINAQAIRNFSPALNMKLVLLCGPSDAVDHLAEDALLLSDQIQDNALITHAALYQIHPLQERLLNNAKYRKFDPDTYLISALNPDYQTLIDRQAEHFLKQNS